MGSRRGTKFRNLCLNRIRPQARVLSSSAQNKASTNSEKMDEQDAEKIGCSAGEKSAAKTGGRKVMVVVDGSAQAKAAMQWALTHAVQNQDIIVLLHATKLTAKQVAGEESSKNMAPRVYELLHSMKTMCQSKKPEVSMILAGCFLIACGSQTWDITGECGDCIGTREGKGSSNSGRGQKTRGGTASSWTEKAVNDMAASDDVGRQQIRRRSRRGSGALHSKCGLHGSCSEKEEQKSRWVFDHHQTSQGLLAFGLVSVDLYLHDRTIVYRVGNVLNEIKKTLVMGYQKEHLCLLLWQNHLIGNFILDCLCSRTPVSENPFLLRCTSSRKGERNIQSFRLSV